MASRLVLGCDGVGLGVVTNLPATGALVVVTDDPVLLESLRNASVTAVAGDPAEPEAATLPASPDVVFVAGADATTNRVALERARDRFPGATAIAYLGDDPSDADRAAVRELADRVVDAARATADAVLDAGTGPTAEKARRLRRTLADVDGRLAIVTHDNPDPDAIASAVALRAVATDVGTPSAVCYYGEISHEENRAMVNLLDLDLTRLPPDAGLEGFGAFALVDHSRPGVNDGLPPELPVAVVVDHHPPRGPVSAEFVDLRVDAGATSTILTDYLDRFGLAIDERLATALLYGIRVDTSDFTREVGPLDFEAAATLLPHVDAEVLDRIEQSSIGGETIDALARAIQNRVGRGPVVVASAGTISSRDVLPTTAEALLNVAGVTTTLVFGFASEMVYVSARSREPSLDLGAVVRDAFAPIGSAGGHRDMAGAQLEVGVLGSVDAGAHADAIETAVEEAITERFFEAVAGSSGATVGTHGRESELLFASDSERLEE